MSIYYIDNQWISLNDFENIIASNCRVELSESAKEAIIKCRSYLDEKIASSDQLIYGINTGFGSLCNTAISASDLGKLQRNLVISHACGMGAEIPCEIIKRILLLKAIGLAHGNSGVDVLTVERLLFFYNNDILPLVFELGSLGASGDLAPLAHISLGLIGEGEVYYKGVKMPAKELHHQLGISPLVLQPKEGLALLNGTQFMSAYASYAVFHCSKMWLKFNTIAALSLDAFDGRKEPFQSNVNEIRNQVGQIEAAAHFRLLMEGSELLNRTKTHVQDPYSFRCIPQVHGASKDVFDHCAKIVEREINAVTDNPTIFPDDDDVVSAGNFHGQPLALSLDFLAIALAELGSISERRTYKLIGGSRGLPAFLTGNPGLNSGLMIVHYACASIVSQNKQLCTPASVDSIDSSNGQEDHVSMGANAATKLFRIIDNCYSIMGIELLNSVQAIEFRRPLVSSPVLEQLVSDFRDHVDRLEEDRALFTDMQLAKNFVTNTMKL